MRVIISMMMTGMTDDEKATNGAMRQGSFGKLSQLTKSFMLLILFDRADNNDISGHGNMRILKGAQVKKGPFGSKLLLCVCGLGGQWTCKNFMV